MKFKNAAGSITLSTPKEVRVSLSINTAGDLILTVGEWDVFLITKKGKGYLIGCIPGNNDEGLQVDEETGTIILEDDDE